MRLVLGFEHVNLNKTLSPFCNFPDGDQSLEAEHRPRVTVSEAGAKDHRIPAPLGSVRGREQMNETQTGCASIREPGTMALCPVPSTAPGTTQDISKYL